MEIHLKRKFSARIDLIKIYNNFEFSNKWFVRRRKRNNSSCISNAGTLWAPIRQSQNSRTNQTKKKRKKKQIERSCRLSPGIKIRQEIANNTFTCCLSIFTLFLPIISFLPFSWAIHRRVQKYQRGKGEKKKFKTTHSKLALHTKKQNNRECVRERKQNSDSEESSPSSLNILPLAQFSMVLHFSLAMALCRAAFYSFRVFAFSFRTIREKVNAAYIYF